MARRQLGHGRGGRMKIESDAVEIRSGVRHGRTLGSPVAVLVANRDYPNWDVRMNPWPVDEEVEESHLPRPGHADLAGLHKFGFTDVRNVLERASARETAARVAAGEPRQGLFDRARRERAQPRHPDRLGVRPAAGRPRTRGLRRGRRFARALPGRGDLGRDGRGDRPPPQGEREPGGQVRGARLRPGAGPGLVRRLGPQARRPPGAGRLLDPVGQGRVARRGLGGRRPPGLRGPRRDLPFTRARLVPRDATGPAAWRAA